MKSTTVFILLVLIFILGACFMYIVYPEINPLAHSPEDAKVNQVNGMYVFIESRPVDAESYDVIAKVEGENLLETIGSLGIGKEKFGKVLGNIFNKSQEKANFRDQIEKIAEQVKNTYPNAEGLIFTNRIRKCEVIVFK